MDVRIIAAALVFALASCADAEKRASSGEAYPAQSGKTNGGYVLDEGWLTPPPGLDYIGDSHGEINVSRNGDIYISVLGGARNGIQVYSADGEYLRNVPGAPIDFHDFILHNDPDGEEYIYGADLGGRQVVKMTTEGEIVLSISDEIIDDEYKSPSETEEGSLQLYFTGIAVGPNGDIYAVDGYGKDFIHRFSADGSYIQSFGGKAPPYSFNICHKVSIDPRFDPVRLVCLDRENDRILHLTLDGEIIGYIREGMRRPSSIDFHGNYMAVAEIQGRVSILDKVGEIVAVLGENQNLEDTYDNEIAPDRWRTGVLNSPHGVAFDQDANILVTEWSKWGRVTRFERRHGDK